MTDEQAVEKFLEQARLGNVQFVPARLMAEEILRLRAEVRFLKEENANLRFGFELLRENSQRPDGAG